MSAPAIHLINVSKRFGRFTAVEGVELAVHPGELVALVGPDGAGKTTLARLAAGALAPTDGRVEPESRGRVGYLTGRFSLYPDLTVWENLSFFSRLYGMGGAELEAEGRRLLEWVGLYPFRDRLAGALSGGMRQKLALACAVIHRPPTLILDEPTTAVDPIARADFWRLLQEQGRQGRAVLVTTPYLDEASYCDRVGLLHRGRLLAAGTAPELVARLPYRMAMLTASGEGRQQRAALVAAAERLPGVQWTQPLGMGVRVALDPGAPLEAPPGFRLAEVEPVLEDAYLWLSDYAAEVMAR
ncbi:MAG: ABC transporter ATP-binding protein [Bacillota bacterium]